MICRLINYGKFVFVMLGGDTTRRLYTIIGELPFNPDRCCIFVCYKKKYLKRKRKFVFVFI